MRPLAKPPRKGITTPCLMPLTVFEEDAAEIAVALVGDEELLAERAELSAAQIADDGDGGVADLAVHQVHGGRQELLDALALQHHAVGIAAGSRLAALAFALEASGTGSIGRGPMFGALSYQTLPAGMSLEGAGHEVLQRARAMPRALVVGVVDFAVRIEAHAAGLRMPLQVGTIVPSGLMRSAQPRKGTWLLNEPVRQSATQRSPALSKCEPKAYSW